MANRIAVLYCSDKRANTVAKALKVLSSACHVMRFASVSHGKGYKKTWQKWSQNETWGESDPPSTTVDLVVVHFNAVDKANALQEESILNTTQTLQCAILFTSDGLSTTPEELNSATLIKERFDLGDELPDQLCAELAKCFGDAIECAAESKLVHDPVTEFYTSKDERVAAAYGVFRECGKDANFELPIGARLQRQLWHALKNLIWEVKESPKEEKLIQRLDAALRHMEKWECCVHTKPSECLDSVKEFVKAGLYKKAYDKAVQCWEDSASKQQGSPGVAAKLTAEPVLIRKKPPRFGILVAEDNEQQLQLIYRDLLELANRCPDYDIDVVRCHSSSTYDSARNMVARHEGIQGAIIDWDLSRGADEAYKRSGLELIKHLATLIPGICCVLLTGHSLFELPNDAPCNFRPVSKDDPSWLELSFRIIVGDVRKRSQTPFFEALKGYSKRPVSVLHALAISGARVVRQSDWLSEFAEFYGDNVFHGESSATQAPLDSLLAPRGSLREAELHAARVYGANHCRFVTNGTSTANKIVHQALLRPGDKVLIDRTCHKSHHYALVLLGASPVYLNAEPIKFADGDNPEFLGFCGALKIETIIKALRENPTAKMLCLTNCTFDGFIHDAKVIIDRVLETLTELRRLPDHKATAAEDFVFFFDEAWFGFARFSRELRRFTGMFAAESYEGKEVRPRVYVTQSVHKTMVAFRQGSIILVRDPQYVQCLHAFEEAFFTHTSTSPSYQILASLDVGRMWADMDGDRMCLELHRIARDLRKALADDPTVSTAFSVLGTRELLGVQGHVQSDPQPVALDETKITLFIKVQWLTGGEVNRRLLQDFDIQFNKFTNNTVLFVLTPGITESVAAHLICALRNLARDALSDPKSNPRPTLEPTLFDDDHPVRFYDQLDLRSAYFGIHPEDERWEEAELSLPGAGSRDQLIDPKPTYVSQRFVIPYPPGFPILVPGQIVYRYHVDFLASLDIKEVHGLSDGRLRVWKVPGTPETAYDTTIEPAG